MKWKLLKTIVKRFGFQFMSFIKVFSEHGHAMITQREDKLSECFQFWL